MSKPRGGSSGFCSVPSVAVGVENTPEFPEWCLHLGWDLLLYQGIIAMRGECAASDTKKPHKSREGS